MNKKEIKKLKNKETHIPLEDATHLLWFSGVHGSLEDTMRIFMEIGMWTPQKCHLLPLFFQKNPTLRSIAFFIFYFFCIYIKSMCGLLDRLFMAV